MNILFFIMAFIWAVVAGFGVYFTYQETNKTGSIIFTVLCIVTAGLFIVAGI